MRRIQTLADIGEVGFLKRLQRVLPAVAANIGVGVGDDAALLRGLSPLAVLSCDMLIEGVDFERTWATPKDIGHKAAAANLSDLAAMGSNPRALLAAVALRPQEPVRDALAMLRSLDAVGRQYGAPLVGGDISKTSGPMVLSVTAVGQGGKTTLRRSAARLGDVVLVSGTLGEAALGLHLLQQGHKQPASMIRRQLRPNPQVALGRLLSEQRLARAAADISDGLAKDALHIVPKGLGVALDLQALPLSSTFLRQAKGCNLDAYRLALTGGEDFELVVAVPPAKVLAARAAAQGLGLRLTAVGTVVRRAGLHLRGERGDAPTAGFDHFAKG